MKTIKILVMSICAVMASVACSKKNSGGGTVATPAVTYYLSNNVCYDAKTNQSVATTNCNTIAYYFSGNSCYATATRAVTDMANCNALVGQYYINNNSCWDKTANTYTNSTNCYSSGGGTSTGRYVWRNNICIDTQTGWSTSNISLCTNSGGTNGDAQCLQPNRYLFVDRFGFGYPADCTRTNCRGQMLYDQQTRTYVNCQ